ncbi:hypothetical protein SCA6_005137 [Theobroma cacao]
MRRQVAGGGGGGAPIDGGAAIGERKGGGGPTLVTIVKKRRLRERRKRNGAEAFEAISRRRIPKFAGVLVVYMALVTKALFLSLNLLFFALVSCQHYVSKKNPFAEDGDFNSHNSRDPIPIRQESGKHSAEDGERNSHESSDSNNSSNLRESMEDGVYLNVLNCLVDAKLGKPPKEPCCSLIEGLVDLEAALCLLHCHQSQCLGHCRPGRSGFFELDSQLLWKGGSFDFQCPA